MGDVEEAAERAREEGRESENRHVALLISVLALLLAVSEILGQRAQTETLQKNIEASNHWAHYQAKSVRITVAETAAGDMRTLMLGITDPALKKAMEARVAQLQANAARLDSDPAAKDGRHELAELASEAEHERDRMAKKHNRLEIASGAFQIGIVLASATIITGILALFWAAGALGAMGAVMLLAGMIA